MVSSKIILAHLYPHIMNEYADHGNLKIIQKRLQDSGFHVEIRPVYGIEELDLKDIDFLFVGGGNDVARKLMTANLQLRSEIVKKYLDEGLPALFISEAYVSLGKGFYKEPSASISVTLNWFDFTVEYLAERRTGNVLLRSIFPVPDCEIVGFMNSAYVIKNEDECLTPLGIIEKADYGEKGSYEGLVYKRWLGTLLHGPVLVKSTGLTDYICQNILDYRKRGKLPPADNRWSTYAQAQVIATIKD